MHALVAFAPIAVALVLMVGLRWPATRAMPLSWAAAVLGALTVWQLSPRYVAALSLHGFITAASVLVIVFGALVILYTLEQGGALETIQWGMQRVSADSRVQAIIIGCMFAAFIEAAAGFGTPAALAAPLLVSLRFPPVAAATLCLVFNSFPVTFGAVGTPIVIGLEYVRPLAEAAGTSAATFNFEVGRWASLLHAPMIALLPLLMLGMMTRSFGERRRFGEGLGAWRFALLGSLCFGAPYVALAWLVGPEFPSLVGGLVGVGAVVLAARARLGVPQGEPWTFGPPSSWEPAWLGDGDRDRDRGGDGDGDGDGLAAATAASSEGRELRAHMSQLRAWLPYLLIGVILVLTRVPALRLKGWLGAVRIPFDDILGFANVDNGISILYLPGTIPFLLVAAITVPLHRLSGGQAARAYGQALHKIARPALALLFSVAIVSIFRLSAKNPAGLPSMPLALAETVSSAVGGAWPLVAAFVGGLGAFITGSNTVSNLLFAEFQYGVAGKLALSRPLIVAAQAVGGAMGNMVCIHNIVAVCAVTGLSGREGALLRRTVRPFLIYGVVVGLMVALLARLS